MAHEERVTVVADAAALAGVVAGEVLARLVRAADGGRTLALGVSGGRTPRDFFGRLARLLDERLAAALDVFWCDERLVPPDDPDSNYGAFVAAFRPAGPMVPHLFRMRGDLPPAAARAEYEAVLARRLDGRSGLDLALLGVGGDGHTASIFPGDAALFAVPDRVALARHPAGGQPRLTLTPAFLAASAEVFYLVSGADKAATVAACLAGGEAALPAARIRAAGGVTHWFLDRAAAGDTGSSSV